MRDLPWPARVYLVAVIGPGAALLGGTVRVPGAPVAPEDLDGRGLPLIKRLFNGAQFAICGYVAGRVYEALHGQVGVPQVNAFDDLIGPYAAAMAVFVPLNIALTLTMIG